ncbi:MAG: hypothetical protein O2780_12475 [Proteobacteria bacterium]|nr:hypothetical protein [Pseudomonadota bacterium]
MTLIIKEMDSFEVDAHGNLWRKSWLDVVNTDTGETMTDGKRSGLKEQVTPDTDISGGSVALKALTDAVYDDDAIDQYYDGILNQPEATLTSEQITKINARRLAAKARRSSRAANPTPASPPHAAPLG